MKLTVESREPLFYREQRADLRDYRLVAFKQMRLWHLYVGLHKH